MKYTFIDLDGRFAFEIARLFKGDQSIQSKTKPIETLDRHRTCFVSCANSLLFYDGGIDAVLSREMMPGIERYLRQTIHKIGRESLVGKKYLPIGSAMLTKYPLNETEFTYLISSPTMLLPQPVWDTRNAYYAMSAVLNVLDEYEKRHPGEIDEVVVPAVACGFGAMSPQDSARQIRWAFLDHEHIPKDKKSDLESVWYPNGVMVIDKTKEKKILEEQPAFYENSEWKKISPEEMITSRKSDNYLKHLP